ncbi:MAG: hypothetical protein C4321_02855 [Chloroflexota bacterium]
MAFCDWSQSHGGAAFLFDLHPLHDPRQEGLPLLLFQVGPHAPEVRPDLLHLLGGRALDGRLLDRKLYLRRFMGHGLMLPLQSLQLFQEGPLALPHGQQVGEVADLYPDELTLTGKLRP